MKPGHTSTEEISGWIGEIASSDSQTAFQSLCSAYFPRLMRFTGLYLSTPAEAEEVVSDTFLSLWNKRKALPGIAHFDSYIYSIAKNKAISYYRSQHIEKIMVKEKEIDLFFQTETTPEEELITKEEISRLNAAINALPDKCKTVFKLVREDNLKYKDVAEILDISVKTVESHLSTAIKKLREALATKATK
ncbi:MAG: RNA polymerase sigma-70 factor [Tannerellaceae bacterium]|jgi:RNA polymerase sigma-70 factor (ECF subfamily)|nr:RNA polymerase sigma-70 factor [Tannerellaceae bacterium]